jgi:hypothetical protein
MDSWSKEDRLTQMNDSTATRVGREGGGIGKAPSKLSKSTRSKATFHSTVKPTP